MEKMRLTARKDGQWYEFATDDPYRWYRITERQLCVLVSLGNDDLTIDRIAFDWPGLTNSATRGRVSALEQKGMVRRVRWDGQAWEYGLTLRGSVVLDLLGDDILEIEG